MGSFTAEMSRVSFSPGDFRRPVKLGVKDKFLKASPYITIIAEERMPKSPERMRRDQDVNRSLHSDELDQMRNPEEGPIIPDDPDIFPDLPPANLPDPETPWKKPQ